MKIQRILVTIPAGELTGEASELLDINYKKLTGVAFLYYTGMPITLNTAVFKNFEMNGEIIFPKNFNLAFVMTNVSVSPDDRFLTINEDNNLTKLNIEIAIKTAEANDVEIPIYLRLEEEK